MLIYDLDDLFLDCVCLLLPNGLATLIDVDVFHRICDIEWQVLGTVIFYKERYTKVVNPTAWPKNRKERVRYRMVSLPRMITGVPYNRMADHISGNRWDNRRSNLRVATGSQNSMNREGGRNKSSRFKGVHRSRSGSWVAQVTYEGNQYRLGSFQYEVAAALAYNAFIKAHCPDFGYLNPISGATADDEPTVVQAPPNKRKSKLKKMTHSQIRVMQINARLARGRAISPKRQSA